MKSLILTIDEQFYNNLKSLNLNHRKLFEDKVKEIIENNEFIKYKSIRWTKEEDLFIRINAKKLTTYDIGEKLNRTPAAILSRACYLKVSLKKILTGENHPNYKKRVKVFCCECKKELQRLPSNVKNHKKFYCSNSCKKINTSKFFKGRIRTERKIIKCENCNKEFRISINSKRKFCDINCKYKHRRIFSDGYIGIHRPDHPSSDKQGYVREHRLVVEEYLGRILNTSEIVHHIDSNRSNNNLSNLFLFPSNSEHIKFHIKIRQFGMTNNIERQIRNRWKVY